MAKQKEQSGASDMPAEDTAQSQPEHSHAEFEALKEQHAELKANHEALRAQIQAHESRLTALEQHAHSGHQLDQQSVDHIVEQATGRVVQHVHKVLGHSGLPARGDQG